MAGEGEEGSGAQSADAGGVGEGKSTGDVGGGDLALGVAGDGGGVDAEVLPGTGERDEDREEDGLDDIDAVECGGVRGTP